DVRGNSSAGEILRCSAQHARLVGQLASEQGRVLQLSDSHREIKTLPNDIDVGVARLDIELDLGKARHELDQMRHDVEPAERGWPWDLEQAARFRIAAAHKILGLLHQVENIHNSLEVALARLRERQLPRGALEQARPEPLLKQIDTFRNNG